MRREGAWAVVVGLLVTGAMAWPLAWPKGRDGFPLSPYPMFARPRPRAAAIPHVVVRTEDGRALVAAPEHLGTDEIMQAFVTAGRAANGGPKAAARLCREVLERVARDPDYAPVASVEVRTDVFDVVEYFLRSRRPLRGRVHARCRPEGDG